MFQVIYLQMIIMGLLKAFRVILLSSLCQGDCTIKKKIAGIGGKRFAIRYGWFEDHLWKRFSYI